MIKKFCDENMPGQPIPIKPVVKRERAMELTDDLKSFKARYVPFKIFLRVGYDTQKFFWFVDFTWSKELSDQWIFLKQNLCHKKPKVTRQ